MKKHHHHFVGVLSCLLFVLGVVSISAGWQQRTEAGGGSGVFAIRLTAAQSSATADGSSTITINALYFLYICHDYPAGFETAAKCDPYGGVKEEMVLSNNYDGTCNYGGKATLTMSGSGNTIPEYICANSSGNATFTVKSTEGETKTITATTYVPTSPSRQVSHSVNVTFNAPAPAPAPKTTPKTTTTQPTTTTEPKAPDTPQLATIKVDDAEFKTDEKIAVASDKSLVLSGKTVANGTVKLYIFSEPKTATTTADANGDWTYEVTGLPAGDHHVEVEVTDPATNKTSERKNLLAFTVTEAAKTVAQTTAQPVKKSGLAWYWWVVGGVVLIGAAAGGGYYWWVKHKQHKATATSQDTTPSSNPFDAPNDENKDS